MNIYEYLGKLAYEYRIKGNSRYSVVCTIILENFLTFIKDNIVFESNVSKISFLKELTTAARCCRIDLSIINQEVIDKVLVGFINYVAYKQAMNYKITLEDLM